MSEAARIRLSWGKNKRLMIILINALLIAGMFVGCYSYNKLREEDRREITRDAFSVAVASMGKNAYGFMNNQQEICNNWARFLSQNRLDLDEAMYYLDCSRSNEEIMVHVVSAETLRGRSLDANRRGSYEVDYSRTPDAFTGVSDADAGGIGISSMYTNPANAMNAVNFARTVTLLNENGEEERYYLLRVVPISVIRQSWVFPVEYEKAELSLIKADGDYVFRSDSLRNQNFWEYMRIYNELDYRQKDELVARMLGSNDAYTGRNNNNEEAFYVCQAAENADWYFVGYVPVSSLGNFSQDFTMVWIVGIGCAMLFLLDGAWIISINIKLMQSAEETRQANMAKTNFLSSMSHDIRTPMNAIIGMTTIASKHITEPEQIQDCLKKITLASNHLLTLINDILDISKVESGKMTLNPVPFSISETLNNLSNIIRPNVRAKNLHFDIHVHNFIYEDLFADELRINQIFINLLSNAVKYTPDGGSIVMDVAEFPLPDDPGRVELVYIVRDNGIGMSKEFQKRMYTPFSRAVDTRIDKIQGSGLGLAITKQMVDLMGGNIECESEEGKGTCFTVRIKVSVADKAAEEIQLPPVRVLLVDDDPIFLETATDTLESLNLQVETAPDGMTALKLVGEKQGGPEAYSVVIVDCRMPGMNGVETTRRMRETVGKDVPIILISSYDWTEVEEEARSAGADDFINKPLFRSSAHSKMSRVLNLCQPESEAAGEETKEFSGLHFLVAEDNDLNWEIIDELLRLYDISADRAINGEICVDMMERAKPGRYDAVLMDIQMPVMNGLDASKLIRGLNNPQKKSIPIIAMTADAFAEDVRACMEAGMNGHVAKPVDMNKLFEELRKAGVRARKREETP